MVSQLPVFNRSPLLVFEVMLSLTTLLREIHVIPLAISLVLVFLRFESLTTGAFYYLTAYYCIPEH